MISLEIKKLTEERVELVTKINTLVDLSKTEQRSMTDEEKTDFGKLDTQLKDLDANLDILKRQNEINAKTAKIVEAPVIAKSTAAFSITKAIRQYGEGKLDGIEAEVNEEGMNENRNIGLATGIGFHVSNNPEVYVRSPLDVTITTDGGGETVPTIKPATLIDALVAATVMDKLGVKTMLGLSGNIDLNKEITPPTASWENEVAEAPLSGIKFNKIPLIPRRLTAKEYISYQLLIQSSISMDAIVENKIVQAFARAIDKDAIDKVLAVASLVAGGPALDWGDVVALRTEVLANNVEAAGASYVSRQEVKAVFETTPKDSGSGTFLIDALGYPLNVSNQIDVAADASSLIFGQFNHAIMAQWGSLIITPDPVSMADYGQWKISVNGYFDNQVEHDAAFAYIADVAH